MRNLGAPGELKNYLTMKNSVISSEECCKNHCMHSKSYNIKVMISINTKKLLMSFSPNFLLAIKWI